jgi:hypothetical protein
MKRIFVALVLLAGFSASAQIKIGANPTTINLGSLLELESSTKGLKFPEVALTSTSLWAPLTGTQVMGMTVYNTATAGDVTPGLYTNNGAGWVKLGGSKFVSAILTKNSSYIALDPAEVTPNNVTTLIFSGSSPSAFTISNLPVGLINIGKILNIYLNGNGTSNVGATFNRAGDGVSLSAQTITNTKGYSFVWDGIGWAKSTF